MSPPKAAAGRMSGTEYAKHRGCSSQAVTQAVAAGRLTKSVKKLPSGRLSIDAKRADLEWAASTYSDRAPLTGPTAPRRGAAGDDEPVSLMDVRNRHELAKAQLAELDLAERRGEILEAREVEARLVGVFSSCKTKLLGVPSRVRQQDPTLTKPQVALVEATIREALEGLAEGGA